ncbi:MAG: collagen binding domain-containing protein, partial [Candidatus Lutacidiplasmatales archaeon]
GLTLVGGSISLAAPPGTVSVLEPVGVNSTNCFPNLFLGGGSPPPLPCQGNHSTLQLQVVDNATGAAIPNASVDITGGCLQQQYQTDAHGFLNLTLPAPDSDNLTGQAGGYHSHKIVHQFFPNGSYNLTLPLDPEPALYVEAWNLTASGAPTPLPGVTVEQGNFKTLGTTGPTGGLYIPRLNSIAGNLTLYGVLPHHSRAQTIVTIPETGVVRANLTLDAAGPFQLRVVDSVTGDGLAGAQGALTNLDPGAPRPTTFTTGPGGWFNLTVLDSANYSLKTNDSGYYPNETWFHMLWAQTDVVVVSLVEKIGATLDALVRNSETGVPVASATVTVLDIGSKLTSAAGWANFTGIKPAGPFEIEASAAGFITNYTWTTLDYSEVVSPYAISLVPIAACAGPPACPGPLGTNAPPFGYLNGGSGVAVLLVAMPAALLVAGVAYAWLASRRNPDPPSRGRGSPPGVGP